MAELKTVRLGVIGTSGRGRSLIRTLIDMDDVEIPAVCDLYDDRVEDAKGDVSKKRDYTPDGYRDYRELLKRDDLDGIVIATSWTTHVEIALAGMKAGLRVATEVAGASSIQECWELVRTSEETGKPLMMLENACYGREELAVLNMVKKGLFGELVHCQCGYEHDLRDEVSLGEENRHYRLNNYKNRNGDIYPTHGIGPMAKMLNINRGNRFISLSSMSSKTRGLHDWISRNLPSDHPQANTVFTEGDVITTMIKCAHGETVLVIHDTTLPRPYSRAGRVQGTRGIWMEDKNAAHIEGMSPKHAWEPMSKYFELYEHPIWKWYLNAGVRGGHDGIDYLALRAYVDSIQRDVQPPIDVYDTAAWMAITALSEDSVALGGTALPFPDFTNGKWINRDSNPLGKYALHYVCEE